MKTTDKKITFALFFGNRGFFPSEVIAHSREELKRSVEASGYDWLCIDESKTRYGAVETIAEGEIFAEFLEENRGNFDGIILSLPNFGDENGALAALKNANVPILVQAYPDKIGSMDFDHRRDAWCGKFAICNILRQADIPYTLTKKFVISPSDKEFGDELKKFASICRVVKGMRTFNLGAIGARTTAFKTVRVDEIALQKKGINVETIDLSDIFARISQISPERCEKKKKQILEIAEFSGYSPKKLETIAKTQAALEDVIRDYRLDAVAIRCWNEFQTCLGIAPCTNLSLLNEAGISAACEVDIANAIMMRALSLAADAPCMLLDYNNNYGNSLDKAIMFHCGPIAPSLLEGKGKIIEHLSFKKALGDQSGVGVNKGKIKSGNITFGSIKTENGRLCSFTVEAEFTDDAIEKAFFGCGKVVQKENLHEIAHYMASNGYKHHLAITYGSHKDVIAEAFEKYLGYDNESL